MDRIVSARVRAQRWYLRYPRAVPTTIFVAVLATAAAGVALVERAENGETRAQVGATADDVGAALQHLAMSHVTYLRAGAMLLSGVPRLTGQGFREMTAGMADDERARGIAGISWAPRVALRDVPAFEAARRAEGLAGFAVYPAPTGARDAVVPITYTSNTGPTAALGFDTASDAGRLAAMDRARRGRRPSATGRVALIRHLPGAQSFGFIVYMPVFAPAARGRPGGGELLGFVSAPFNARDLLLSALATMPTQDSGVSLYDGAARPDRLLARVAGGTDGGMDRGGGPAATRLLTIADRRLVLVVQAPVHGWLSGLSQMLLLFALLVAALLALLARVLTRHAQEDLAALEWLEEQVSIRNTLTRELNHRVKNTLANVLSIVALTRRRATGLDHFAESLTGRIMALSATHDLLTGLSWEPAPLRAVIAAELAPYTGGRDHAISITGPEVALAPKDALSLGLAVHELATNAGKYGAFSVVSGELVVHWDMVNADLARIVWQERGGPPVAAQRRHGFGTDLIEKIVAHELGHSVDLRFDPQGVRCSLLVPVRQPVTGFQMRAAR